MGAAASAALAKANSLRADTAGGPNIIIIMADDLGYADLSCFGSGAISTPNADRLAEQGVKLTSFFSSGPVCSPSRAGLLTGRYPARAGVHFVFMPAELWPLAAAVYANYRMPWGLPKKEITLADALKQAALCALKLDDAKQAMELAAKIPVDPVSKTMQIRILAKTQQYNRLIDLFGNDDIGAWPESEAGEAFLYRGSRRPRRPLRRHHRPAAAPPRPPCP